MPFVNYVAEHKAFIEYASNEGLSSSERLVWYALIHIMNSRAKGANWPDGFIRIPNERLLTYLPLSFDAMAKARNRLIQRGLISFIKGARNSAIPMYEMHYLTVPDEESPQIEGWPVDNCTKLSTRFSERSESCPEKTDRLSGNLSGNPSGNPSGNLSGNPSDIIDKLYEEGRPYSKRPEEEEERVARTRVGPTPLSCIQDTDPEPDPAVELERRVAMAIRANFGHEGTPEECAKIANLAALYHLEPDLVEESIRLAAQNHARSVFAYLMKVYDEWQLAYVRSLDDYSRYRFAMDMATGRLTGIAAPEYREVLDREKKERRAKYLEEDGLAGLVD